MKKTAVRRISSIGTARAARATAYARRERPRAIDVRAQRGRGLSTYPASEKGEGARDHSSLATRLLDPNAAAKPSCVQIAFALAHLKSPYWLWKTGWEYGAVNEKPGGTML